MATALQKLPEMTDFEAARERWDRANQARRQLLHRLEGCKAALQQLTHPPADDEPGSSRLRELAKDYLGGKRPDIHRLEREHREIVEAVEDDATAFAAERQAWDQALSAERGRLAVEAMPRLQAVARRLCHLVEQLSLEVEAGRAIHGKLLAMGVMLPDPGAEFGSLSDYHSLVSTWNRRMLALGLL